MKEKVSIITPCYNSYSYLNDCFLSIKNQTYENWEWIVVDDCSNDNSFELINFLAKEDNRIRVFKTETNGGSAVARNIGLKNCLGRYVTFLDADDLLDPTYLEKQVKFIQEKGPIVVCSYRRMAPQTTTDFIVPSVSNYKSILKGNPLSCLTTMFDRSVFKDEYFPEDMKKCEDFVFWLNILRKSDANVYGSKDVLATYRIHKSSKSHKKFDLIKYMFLVYHKTQRINFFSACYYVVKWAFYGKKKYRGVK